MTAMSNRGICETNERPDRLYYLGNRWELEAVLWSVSQADVLVEMTKGQPLTPSGYRDNRVVQ